MFKRFVVVVLLIGLAVFVAPIFRSEYRFQMYKSEIKSCRQLVTKISKSRPPHVPEKQWEKASEWAGIVISNVHAADYYFPLEELRAFRIELERRCEGPIDLNTIDWIWAHLKSGKSGGAKYTAKIEPQYRYDVYGEPSHGLGWSNEASP